jgi:hypothetical protein
MSWSVIAMETLPQLARGPSLQGPWRGVRQQQQQHVAGSMGGSEKVATSRKELGEAGAAEGGPMAEVQEVGVGLVGVPGGRIDPPMEINQQSTPDGKERDRPRPSGGAAENPSGGDGEQGDVKVGSRVAGTLGRREEVDGDKYVGGGRHGLVHVGGRAGGGGGIEWDRAGARILRGVNSVACGCRE